VRVCSEQRGVWRRRERLQGDVIGVGDERELYLSLQKSLCKASASQAKPENRRGGGRAVMHRVSVLGR
jgi:hypothetical protein